MNGNPRDAAAATQFAHAAAAAGDPIEARDAYRAAIRSASPPDADLLAGLGDAQVRLGETAEALAAFRQLEERFPLDVRGYLGACSAQDALGHRREAASVLDAALQRLPPDDVAGRARIVGQFEAFRDLAKALAEAEALAGRAPDNSDAILLATHLQIKSERPDRALPLLKKLLAREPANARGRSQLGVVLDSPLLPNRSPQLAEDALLTAIETSPSETPAYRRLIELYEQDRRYKQCAYVAVQAAH